MSDPTALPFFRLRLTPEPGAWLGFRSYLHGAGRTRDGCGKEVKEGKEGKDPASRGVGAITQEMIDLIHGVVQLKNGWVRAVPIVHTGARASTAILTPQCWLYT